MSLEYGFSEATNGLKCTWEELLPGAVPMTTLGGGAAVTRIKGLRLHRRAICTTPSFEGVSTGSSLVQERPGI